MLTLTFYNDDVLTIPETAIADFRALGITQTLRFKNGHWIASNHTQAFKLDLYVEQLKQLKTSAHSVDPSSDKTALDNLLDGDYQIISFEHDNDLQTYVVWKSVEEDESVNKHQTITKEVTPNGEVLRILIVNENA
jgi:hypothetical protein